jgi:hypothetical protein
MGRISVLDLNEPREDDPPPKAPPSWRFALGVAFLGLGLSCPVFIPIVTAADLSTQWKTVLSGLLMLGIPEVLWLAAAAVMGKAGFEHLKGRLWGLLKRHAPPERVSPTRYRLGLLCFTLPLLFGWLGPYGAQAIPFYSDHRFAFHLVGDLLFLTSFFVLGGEFWDKIRALFSVRARAHIPEK